MRLRARSWPDDWQTGTSGGPTVRYADLVKAANPVSYWKLDDAAGIVAADTVAGGVNGTYTGTVALQAAALGDGHHASFNGGYVSVGADARYCFSGQAPFSYEAWVSPTTIDDTYRRILARVGASGYYMVSQSGAFGALRVSSAMNGALTAAIWSHVAGSYDGATLSTWLNGVQIRSVADASALPVDAASLYLGSQGGASPFFGALAHVAIYNYALAPATIASHAAFKWG